MRRPPSCPANNASDAKDEMTGQRPEQAIVTQRPQGEQLRKKRGIKTDGGKALAGALAGRRGLQLYGAGARWFVGRPVPLFARAQASLCCLRLLWSPPTPSAWCTSFRLARCSIRAFLPGRFCSTSWEG